MKLEISLNNYKKCDGCPCLDKLDFLTRFFAYNTWKKLYFCKVGYDWKSVIRYNTKRPTRCIQECGK